MHPISQTRISQILNPTGQATAPTPAAPAARITLEQIVQPHPRASTYTGAERRAQGYLIAEVIPNAPAVDGTPAGAELQG